MHHFLLRIAGMRRAGVMIRKKEISCNPFKPEEIQNSDHLPDFHDPDDGLNDIFL